MQTTANYGLKKPDGTDLVKISDFNANFDIIDNEIKTMENGLVDYSKVIPYAGTTAGTANVYTITTPTITALTAGMAISLKFNVDSTAASTLNWCSLGAKGIKKSNGTNVTNLKAAGIYTLRYDGTNFILQGEGASGTALASDLLSGKTASTDAGDIVGTMNNYANNTVFVSNHSAAMTVTVDGNDNRMGIIDVPNILGVAGKIDETTRIQAQLWGLIPSNIVAGACIGQYPGYGSGYMTGTATISSLGGLKIASGSTYTNYGTLSGTIALPFTPKFAYANMGGFSYKAMWHDGSIFSSINGCYSTYDSTGNLRIVASNVSDNVSIYVAGSGTNLIWKANNWNSTNTFNWWAIG